MAPRQSQQRVLILSVLIDLVLMSASFFMANYLKNQTFRLTRVYELLLLTFCLAGIVSSWISRKYLLRKPKSFSRGLQPFFRSFVYMTFLLLLTIFFFKLFQFSRLMVVYSLLIYLLLQVVAYSVVHIRLWGLDVEVINEEAELYRMDAAVDSSTMPARIDIPGRKVGEAVRSRLQNSYLRSYPEIFKFIDGQMNLRAIKAADAIILKTNRQDVLRGIMNNKLEFLINLRRVNDINRIHAFLLAANERLIRGGYFVGIAETLELRRERKFARFPQPLFFLLCFLDFLWTRVVPRVPVLNGVYFMVHGRESRVMSRYELLGRLMFSGFRIISLKDFGRDLIFISQKAGPPKKEKNPSYGFVFRQKRVGLEGALFHAYKFRTMYPFSEFLHKYLHDSRKLNSIGKIQNDPRITSWGRFMRRYWIDELPMVINLLRGDLKLVGVRPISPNFLDTYPEELKKERLKYKPGLFPAFYADQPEMIAQIWKAEWNYLRRYAKHPWRTDFSYFFRILYNIIFKNVRSN